MNSVEVFMPEELAAVTHELGIEAGNCAILEVRLQKANAEVARLVDRERQLTEAVVARDRTIDELRTELGAKSLPSARPKKR